MLALIGAPAPVRLVELGPGRGTLMADILRVAAKARDFRDAASRPPGGDEPGAESAPGRDACGSRSRDRLARLASRRADGPLLLVANEFFDALPMRQFVRADGAWRERVVGIDESGALAFGIGPGVLEQGPAAPEGSIFEVRPSADAIAAEIARRIVEDNGAALFVDYGHAETAAGDTLQAVSGHRFADPLAAPGEADLTAHVDFAALVRSAAAEGARCARPDVARRVPDGAGPCAARREARCER